MWGSASTSNPRDILSRPWWTFALFWLPVLAIVVTGAINVGVGWRTLAWSAALCTMGVACVANAIRCGRVHCYVTGPFFLLMAVVTLLYGLGFVSLPGDGWNLISVTSLVGAIALCYLPEMILGKYRRGGAKDGERC